MRELQLAFISNRTTSRLFQILSVIERDRRFTIGELAEQNQVTQRTIANDIKYIKEYFAESILLSSGNKGFLFEETQPFIYQKKKRNLLENECLFEIIGNIFNGKLLTIDELAHQYHFSESTFRRLLGQTNHTLKSYGLRWESNPLTIAGNEANLRKFFKDFYYEGVETAYTLLPDPALHQLLIDQFKEKLGHYDIGSGTTPTSFHYTLYIAIQRASKGYSITVPTKLAQMAYNGVDFPVLYSLKEGIKERYGTSLSREEFSWIYLVTVCKRTVNREDQERKFFDQFYTGTDMIQLTDDFLRERALSTENEEEVTHFLRSFFLSRRITDQLSPVLNKEMKDIKETLIEHDEENYVRNYRFLQKHKKRLLTTYTYLDDVCVALTIYSQLIFDLYSPVKTIYFLLEGDHFVCQHIRTRATQLFGHKHSLTFVPLQQLTKEELNEAHIDLFVTNYNRYILDYMIETDYLLMKAVPDEQDWTNLKRKIDSHRRDFF
ncbi:hypothetical protein A5868_001385 [Enterococcus sp. 12F9_DIV0723]|uniref:helix-turn-helix domain-containing protein n=2 Tax=unclassified Enterococcus TaxID=2608891 RepID=UPI000B3E8213|nr:helix-turn-helix domain-containing protein [Enterococcus sp. 12F9_DIV0723]OUZ16464.1 hypothetical protein A5868_001385 [Enterococcus sp. 12F9_DIV0723]